VTEVEQSTGRLRNLKLQKNGQFPDEPVKIKGTENHYVNSQTY
jgi:hypothetical protein